MTLVWPALRLLRLIMIFSFIPGLAVPCSLTSTTVPWPAGVCPPRLQDFLAGVPGGAVRHHVVDHALGRGGAERVVDHRQDVDDHLHGQVAGTVRVRVHRSVTDPVVGQLQLDAATLGAGGALRPLVARHVQLAEPDQLVHSCFPLPWLVVPAYQPAGRVSTPLASIFQRRRVIARTSPSSSASSSSARSQASSVLLARILNVCSSRPVSWSAEPRATVARYVVISGSFSRSCLMVPSYQGSGCPSTPLAKIFYSASRASVQSSRRSSRG